MVSGITGMSNTRLASHASDEYLVVRKTLLAWSKSHYRDLPWRSYHEPYPILVAEMLLKRTTASAVAKIYERLLSVYPTLGHLAEASESTLAEELRSLGLYHQRAKTLIRLSLYLRSVEGMMIPNSLEGLLSVPGLGDYSARAILCFGYGYPVAVVDSNVERIIHRLYQNRLPERASKDQFQAIADALLPRKRYREFNFAMLDLGSLICRPSYPKCEPCQLSSLCDFARLGPRKPESQLRAIRRSRGLSLIMLSQISGISKSALMKIEAGQVRPRPRSANALAKALGVEPEVIESAAPSQRTDISKAGFSGKEYS